MDSIWTNGSWQVVTTSNDFLFHYFILSISLSFVLSYSSNGTQFISLSSIIDKVQRKGGWMAISGSLVSTLWRFNSSLIAVRSTKVRDRFTPLAYLGNSKKAFMPKLDSFWKGRNAGNNSFLSTGSWKLSIPTFPIFILPLASVLHQMMSPCENFLFYWRPIGRLLDWVESLPTHKGSDSSESPNGGDLDRKLHCSE